MIKITKPGQKEFYAFCKWCGCEFTYEISDLKLSATSDKVECPTCGKDYYHTSMVQDPTIPGGIWPLQTLPFTTYNDPCEGCAWKSSLGQLGTYVGDTPCTWCNKKQVTNKVGDTPLTTLTGTGEAVKWQDLPITLCTDDSCSCSTSDHTHGITTAHNSEDKATAFLNDLMAKVNDSCGCKEVKAGNDNTECRSNVRITSACSSGSGCKGKTNCKNCH